MTDEREPTDLELENLHTEALGDLANAVREYEVAKQTFGQQKPTLELATKRFVIARDAIRQSLRTLDIIRRQQLGN